MWRFLLLLVLLPLLAMGALFTPWGLGLAVEFGARFVPGLTVQGAGGQLPGRLTAERIALTDAQGAWLEVEGVELRLDWRDLAQRRVTLEVVQAARTALHRLPPSAPSEPTPLALPSLPQLPFALSLRQIDLPRVELGQAVLGQAVLLSLAGSAAIESGRLNANLALLRLDRPGAAAINLVFQGENLTARVEASEPPGGLVAALAGTPEAAFALQFTLDGGPWHLRANLGAAETELSGTVGLSPEGALALTLQGHAVPGALLPEALRPLTGRIELDAALRRSADGALALDRLALDLPALTATAEGGLEPLDARFRIRAGAPGLFAGFLPGLAWDSLIAEGRISGSIAAPELTVNVTAQGLGGLGETDAMLGEEVRLTAEANPSRFTAQLSAARVQATLSGPTGLPLDHRFTLEARDPPGLTGMISAEGQLRGTPEALEGEMRLRSDRLEGQGQFLEALDLTAKATLQASLARLTAEATGLYQSRPLRLSLSARRDGEQLRLERLEARFAEITVTGSGSASLPQGPLTGTLRLDAPDLSRLEMGMAGRLSAELEARAIPGATGPAAQGITLRANGTGLGTTNLRGAVQAEAGGTLARLDFRLGVTAPEGALNLAGNLALPLVTLTRLEARSGADALTLAGPARIRLEEGVVLEPTRLTSRRGGSLALQGRLVGGQLNARAELSAVPLGPLSGGMVTGTASGQIIATGSSAAPDINATLRAENLRASQTPQLPPAQVNATARLQGQALRAEARITAGPAVQLDVTAQQPRGLSMAAPIEAALRGRLDLGSLARPFLAGGADRLSGRLALDLRATGTPAAPVLGGSATLTEGGYTNPIYGTRIEGLTARITAQGERLLVESLSGRTGGGGTISGQGWIEPLGAGLPAEFNLRADAARPISGELGDATVDAALTLRGPLLEGGSLSGRITIQRADLRIPENLAGSIPSLGRVRQVGPSPPGRPAPAPPSVASAAPSLPMALDLTITAPRAVFIRGRGLEAELGGEVVVKGTLDAPQTSGGLRLRRGSFDLAGRQLQFSRGVIGFDANNLSPTLDFLATARSRSHTINLAITGTLALPVLTVTSEPDLPQDEALARLLFDRETNRLSPFEIVTIAQAAAQLAGLPAPGAGAVDRLRRGLGLDRLGVASDSAGRAALEAGGYVAPGVYLGVRQGAGGTPGVNVQVELTPRLRLEGQTSTGPGGDRVGLTWELEY